MRDQISDQNSKLSQSLNPQLQGFIDEIQGVKKDAQKLVQELNERQFNWIPEPGSWFIAECLDHLTVVGSKLLPLINDAVDRARKVRLFSQGPFNAGFLGRRFIRSQEPPVKRRVKTFKQYIPPRDHPLDEVILRFMRLQDQIIDRIRAANGLDLERIKISSPVSKLIRFNLAVWFAATAAHERRHLWQAKQIRKNPNFPSACISGRGA